jgi:hypothetical protein
MNTTNKLQPFGHRRGKKHRRAGGPQGCRPVVLAADHGANRKPALEEQAGHGSPDRAELTGS